MASWVAWMATTLVMSSRSVTLNSVLLPRQSWNTRKLSRSSKVIDQWIIDWKGLHLTSATWEDAIYISKKFPNFNLADKTTSNGHWLASKSIQYEPKKGLRSRKPSTRFDDFVMERKWDRKRHRTIWMLSVILSLSLALRPWDQLYLKDRRIYNFKLSSGNKICYC
ncbi:hypothetical protein GQ457_06G015040 [Hibiscus cannabinus]